MTDAGRMVEETKANNNNKMWVTLKIVIYTVAFPTGKNVDRKCTFPSFPICKTYLNIFPEFLQEHFLVLLINVDLLTVIDEVIVLVGGQLLGLPISVID